MPIRPAIPADGPTLTALRRGSKGHWGYSAEWTARVEGPITVPGSGDAQTMFVFEGESTGLSAILAFYSLLHHDPATIELDDFFVDPPHIGTGLGKLLWQDAVARCSSLGYRQLNIIADPNAAAFYIKRGARRIGAIASRSDPTRILPTLVYELPP